MSRISRKKRKIRALDISKPKQPKRKTIKVDITPQALQGLKIVSFLVSFIKKDFENWQMHEDVSLEAVEENETP